VGVDQDLINHNTDKEGDHQDDIEYNANYDPPAVNNKPTPVVKQPVVLIHTNTPVDITGVCRSTRDRTNTVQPYQPSFRGKKYAAAMAQLHENGILHPGTHLLFNQVLSETAPDTVAMIFTQLSLRAGLRQRKGKAKEAAYAEMKQLHMRDTFCQLRWEDLLHECRKSVLESHMFLKQKRDDNIKGHTVAGGNKQRDFISKEEATLLTVSTESVLFTCIIDAQEGRDVGGVLADMLVDIAPKQYKKYLTKDKKGNSLLLLECLNAIYGTMVASLLYYGKFSETLKRHGFKLNPYDPCVANCTANKKQQIVCWHVDGLKLSHVQASTNDNFIEALKSEYESIFEDGSGKM
jgi:hypothetical protein